MKILFEDKVNIYAFLCLIGRAPKRMKRQVLFKASFISRLKGLSCGELLVDSSQIRSFLQLYGYL